MRFLALLAACAVVASIEAVDPCKRQPFRGRCPSKNGESPKRSQFVLRYYMRNGECVSYPYGHCANDDSEPQLYRYKEECEDACINPPPANLGSPKSDIDQTYGTVGPVGNAVQPNEAAVTQTSAETTTQADNTSRSVSTQSPATTECERRRAAAAASTIRGGFVPACTAHGAFEKVQCEPDGRQCFCVDAKGIEIANSRTRNGQKPDCDGIQLSSAPKTKECVGGAARGPCSAALTRWYYDEQEAKCKRFTFSGCGGNGNNYDTEEACIRRCAPPPMGLPKCEKGEPLKTKLGVPVNCAKSDCPYGYKCSVVQQTSVCCPENNKIIGLQTSGSADVCSLPKERGPCDNYELRFYYNAELKECKYFFWGGCQGNKNNFEKVEDCEATCGIAKAKDSIPTTPAPSTQSQRLPFRTTQGIRITPGNFSKNEDGSIVESSTTVTSPPVAATAPGRVFTPEPKSAFESLVTSENIKSDPTIPATVHVAPTRAPPIPQMALLEVNRCLHPKDPGTCRGQFIRWYWDNDRKTCDVFTYTGCQGNGNNYASREECLAICHKEATPVVVHDFSNVCKHDVDAGECNGVFQRFAFDTESGECRPFTYGGCGGNGNNFATLAECRIKCQKDVIKEKLQFPSQTPFKQAPQISVALSPGNLCEHDIEVGECSGVFVRFGYDKATNDCRQFTYGGCGGNGNNFATIQECRNVCIRKVCNPNPQCDLTRCQIVNDRNGCPFCSCPPTSQPSPPGALQCPEVNVDTCKEPCIIINNRKGCKDCVCPSLSGSIGQPPASFEDQDPSPIAPSTSRPVTPTVRTNHISARPPSAPTSVGPPSGPTPNRSSPPGTVTGHFSRRQESVPTVQSSQSKQVEIGSKQLLPPPLSAHLQEKCMQPVEPGPCKHFVDRWFFNGEDGTCHPFKYGGCAGNRNHFFSQNECEIHCARFLRIISDDDEEEEDFVEEIPRRAAGVAQVHTRDPIEFEHYHPPSPPSQGSSQPQAIHEDMAGYSIGREPVPLSPTGIGRNMEKLDIDGLEEPTTIIPLATTTLPAATNTTATTSTHAAATSTQATSTPLATTGKQLSAEPSTTQTQTTLTSTVQTQTTGSPTTTTPASTTQPSTTQAASTQTSSTPPPPTTSTPTTQPPVTYAQTTPAPTSRPTPASSPVTTRATPQTTPQPTQPTTTRNVPRTAATVGVPTEREEIDARVLCALPPDAGPCFEYVPRWFFNAQSGQCEQFSYGSCGGNENNFADRSVCEIKCLRAHSTLLSHVPERCTYERDGGSGKGYNVKWYFNMKNLRCEQFVYEGRGGNQNQFETLSDCERYCSPQPGSPKYVIPPTTTTIRPPAPPVAPQTQPRPSAGQPVPDRQTIEDILDYDEKLSHFVEESVTSTNAPPNRPVSNTIDNRDNSLSVPAPQPPISNPVQSPGTQPRPPAAQAAKTVVHKEKTPERSTNVATGQERRKEIYKAEPLPSKPPTTGNENLPIVGPSPPMSVNYQTGEVKNRASGIRTFQQSASRVIVEDSDLTEGEEPRRDLLSCPNGLKELRYADGRPVMCLPGKNQCPEKSVCYFNGVDFFCCPNEEDPYDKHVFGGYDGEETKHGYKVFGPLNIRRLMDEVPLRARREARSARVRRQASSNGFTAPQSSFSIDSITAPLRFDEEKPRTVSRAQRMRSNPSPPHHGNPICIEPLATGDCGAAHLRYYYDRDSDKCRLFYYTGCKGNNNNFGSMIDCQRLCVLGGQRPRPESDASTPPPVLRGQCPDGKSPLGGSAPVLCGNTTDSIGCPTGFFCLHGPPDICCPNGEVKRKVEKGSVRFAPEVPGVPRAHSRNVLLSTPKYMCPDASDPLMASNGEPTNCGAGFDGMKLCPKGFYCAIDVEKQSRMCCPLYGAAERVPTEQGPAPYLGRRPSNPGEVLERGSLPSDQSEYISRTRKEQMQERRRQMLETTTSVFAEESEEFEDGEEEEDEEEGMAHLMLKPAESSQPKAEPATSTALPESEDHHIIDLPTEPPTVEEAQPVKTAEDKSVCQIKPSEGRACREDEKPPRTNLHYFYSPKDRRCKLYFFRGCGGNANRFEKKADCERLCLS
nr:Thyroglobulin type-1 and Proteinase inhibitor I2 domain containing protein [Haemonchus contortus]